MSSLFLSSFPVLPLAKWINAFVDWLTGFAGFFNAITAGIAAVLDAIQWVFDLIPAWLFIGILLALTWYILRNTKHWFFMIFELLGLLLIWNQGYWHDMTQTLTLVIATSLIIIVIGVPLGIWMAKNHMVNLIFKPILSFMQTMPAFVYLIPAVALFGIGMVPGVVASVIFSLPPIVNTTYLGIKQVPADLNEAAVAFGCTPLQKLFKVELPIAKATIISGINQGMMLALSMVVIASMIGTMGLGSLVYFAVGRNDAGAGFAAGIAIVILAIIIDKISEGLSGTGDDE